jgi:hypothetical protein
MAGRPGWRPPRAGPHASKPKAGPSGAPKALAFELQGHSRPKALAPGPAGVAPAGLRSRDIYPANRCVEVSTHPPPCTAPLVPPLCQRGLRPWAGRRWGIKGPGPSLRGPRNGFEAGSHRTAPADKRADPPPPRPNVVWFFEAGSHHAAHTHGGVTVVACSPGPASLWRLLLQQGCCQVARQRGGVARGFSSTAEAGTGMKPDARARFARGLLAACGAPVCLAM